MLPVLNMKTQEAETLHGKRVEIEGTGIGTIVDETEFIVGVLLDGKGCRVMYVRKEDLEKSAEA